jgi:hypothetical protein
MRVLLSSCLLSSVFFLLSFYSAPLGFPVVGIAPAVAYRTSCVVMNSSSTGLPSLVARMPFTIACTTC